MRVLAVNDISCVGKCSLTVALPVLSACGVTCDILPTALLSTHTGGFTGYTFLPLDDEMNKIADHWETLGLKYDLSRKPRADRIREGYQTRISQRGRHVRR